MVLLCSDSKVQWEKKEKFLLSLLQRQKPKKYNYTRDTCIEGSDENQNFPCDTSPKENDNYGDERIQKVSYNKEEEIFQKSSKWDKFSTFLSLFMIGIVGLVRDFITPEAPEKNREGYVPLLGSFQTFFKRRVINRGWNCYQHPITGVPGGHVTILNRSSSDRGKTIRFTGEETKCINFGSYNYLGFGENSGACSQAAIKAVHENGVAICSTRNELGNSKLIVELEKKVAKFVGTEDAIVCGMGFATNSLNLPSIISKNCLVISDEKNHASIIMGLRVSQATIRVFKHNDMNDLEKHLKNAVVSRQPNTKQPWEKILIIVEGIYSVEGSIVNLPEVIALKKKYQAYLYLDEAHSIGALGKHGGGVVDYFGCNPKDVDILMGTFTKSFAAAGGYIAGSRQLINMLRRTSPAQSYCTSMPPPVVQQILTSMGIIMGENGNDEGVKRIQRLARNTRYFRDKLKQAGFVVYGHDDSPVVPTALYTPPKGMYTGVETLKRGVATVVVTYPVVPLDDFRTRFCISAAHTKEMLDEALRVFLDIGEEINVRNSSLPKKTQEIIY